MTTLGTASVEIARLRRRLSQRLQPARPDGTTEFISRYGAGRSFVDIGGMYGIDGAVAFRAELAGATEVTLFDAGEPTPAFMARKQESGSGIRCVQGDLEDPVSVAQIGVHDLVYCAGVVYHTPNPVLQLLHLREITREFLLISSATIPEIPGFPQACVYLPHLETAERAALARGADDPDMAVGLGTPFDDRPMYGHGNFWFGITPSALRAMLRTARFEVVEEFRPFRYPWGVQYVARPIDEAPLLPPVDYFRRRGEALAENRTLPFDGFYDKGFESTATPTDGFPDLDGLPRNDTSAVKLPSDRVRAILRRLTRG
jgi:SAM-dependent methyltransferase